MNERVIQAISNLKKAQNELEIKLKAMEQNIDEKGSLNMQKALFTVADDLARYTIKDGNWYYNGKDMGIQAEAHDGKDGEQGPQGIPGKEGKPGKDGRPGRDGKDGKDGRPGRDGKDGKPGKDGRPGRDGKDGITPELKIGKIEVSPEYGGAMAKLRPGKDNTLYLDLTLPRGPQGFAGFDGKDAKINGVNTLTIEAGTNITLDQEGNVLTINSTGGGASDYADLTNKPKINNVELNGNKSLNDLGIQPAGNYALESDMTEAQNDIEALQTENERLKATLPTTTGEGQDITLDKTAEMEFVKPPLPRGNTKQDTTTGKNLLPPLDSGSLNGLTFTTNSNGITTISGTTTSVTTYFKNVNKILPAGTYTLSINLSYTPPANSSQLILQDINNARLATINLWKITSKTFTLSADTEIKNYYLFSNSEIQHNGTISIQLEKGSTATSYEPYTGGIPSPNPDYPQEIHTITGNNEIKISNKNLIASVQRNGNSLFFNGTNSQTEYIFKAGTYTLSFVNENITSVYIKTPSTNATSLGSNSPKTFTSDEDFNIWIYRSGMTSDETTNIQLEKGTTATTYVEHKEQEYPINLGDIEFCGIGDYKDVPFKNTLNSEYYNSSLELNKWYLKKNIGKVVLNGSEAWEMQTDKTNSMYIQAGSVIYSPTASGSIPNAICSHFEVKSAGAIYNNDVQGLTFSVAGYLRVNVLKSIVGNTIANFKTWLSTNNTTVYYVLATPTYTLLNDTLQTQLEEISKALSYQGQTNITSNTIALFDVEAYQSTKLILENLDSRLTLVEG